MANDGPTFTDVDFVETPNFVFPMRTGLDSTQSSPAIRTSPQFTLSPPAPSRHGLQRKSASALPTFSFNSSDTSGLGADWSPPSPASPMLTTPRGHGHRRGASELVGGSASTTQISTPFSFTPTSMLSADTPVRQGHAHRRSAAISVTELPQIFPIPQTTETRSRVRVDFAENVQIIPRPLSTVSTDSNGTITASGTVSEANDLDIASDDIEAALEHSHIFKDMHCANEGQWLKRDSHMSVLETSDIDPPANTLSGLGEFEGAEISRCMYARRKSADLERPSMAPRARSAPGPVPSLISIETQMETERPDLEALFSQDPFTVSDDVLGLDLPRLDLGQISNFRPRFDDDDAFSPSIKIDLDDAAIPDNSGRMPNARKVPRQLHSSRIGQNSFRGRAASAPLLARFEAGSKHSPAPSSMADVFEEDEDEQDNVCVTTAVLEFAEAATNDGLGIGRPAPYQDTIEIVAADDEPRESHDYKLHADPLTLSLPVSATASLMTPTTYTASTFSTPDIQQRYIPYDGHLATCASSITDCKTTASSTMDAPAMDFSLRPSVDGVPSLTSTRSTISRKLMRGLNSLSVVDLGSEEQARRKKRSSIHSLTKFMLGGDDKDKAVLTGLWVDCEENLSTSSLHRFKAAKEKRLSKLLFWRNRRPFRTATA